MIEQKPDILPVIEQETTLKKVGRTHGGEYAGPCPLCGGRDRFRVWPERGRFWCRGCGASGDVVDFIMKLRGLSFKDACVHLGIRPGRPAPIDPAIHRRKEIQKQFQENLQRVYFDHCDRAVYLHRLRLQVKDNPSALTDAGAVSFALAMGELAQVENNLDTMLYGSTEDQIEILKGATNERATINRRAA